MRRWRVSVRFAVAAVAALGATACSLLTDLGGATGGGDDDDASPGGDAGGTSDAVTSGDGPTSTGLDASNDTTTTSNPDGGVDAAPPIGVISNDPFDTSCSSWTPYNATVTHVADAYAGAGACKVCLTTTGVGGGITRSYVNVEAGTYFVSGRVKNINSTDWRITVMRTLDGAAEANYVNLPFSGATWQLAEASAKGESLTDVNFWFGDTFQAGDCALVDEVTVRVVK